MEYYFGQPSDSNQIILNEDESNHLLKVKRSQIGETVLVTDGNGNLFKTEISKIEKRNCVLSIVNKEVSSPRKFQLHIGIAPTKNLDRMEWFLEKATETGIDSITFLRCRHSERKEVNTERLNRVAIAAIKQSGKTFLPVMNPIIPFNTFIQKECIGSKLLFTMSADVNSNLKNNYSTGMNLLALIGPEGDFHSEEIELAVSLGFKITSLGEERLRTETAALSVCTIFNFINS